MAGRGGEVMGSIKGMVWGIIKFGIGIFVVMAVFYLLYMNHVGFREVTTWGFTRLMFYINLVFS